MATWSNILFYLLFLSQIFLISHYLFSKLLARMALTLQSYPPAEYPKLYPKPLEYYRIIQWAFKMANRAIIALGIFILFAIIFMVDHANFADDGFISEAWPAAYGMIQFIPLMFLEFAGFRQLKLMRKVNSEKTRSADLHRRSIFDYVSPTLLGLTVFFYLAAILFDLYLHDFNFQLGHDTMQRIMILSVTNSLMAAFSTWLILGPKLNPHQSLGDQKKHASVNLKSMFFVSIAMSIFFMTLAADDVIDLDFLDASLMSLYFQIIAFVSIGHALNSLKLEDIDFSAYKNDTAIA